MSRWSKHWDLTSVPDDKLYSEVGRRRSLKAPQPKKKLRPCKHCGILLGARERRLPCPDCGKRQGEAR